MIEEVVMLKSEELAGLNKRSILNMPTSGGEIPHKRCYGGSKPDFFKRHTMSSEPGKAD